MELIHIKWVLVITARRVLRLQMEEKAFRYRGEMIIY
jgi:hypothetical protein